ncbi:hypothetical protein HNR67_002836 [Crossiella cryophila]|uniref:Uncharacterized protein n=1 Tax=Crossiella cryophila TaxID=43355 RepID=A0A7W7FTS0_9PSEU|nr:hypothetical protein [Crossiella cryophila]
MAFQTLPERFPHPRQPGEDTPHPGCADRNLLGPSLPTATVCVPGMWFGIGRLTGMGEPYEHCSSSLLLSLIFPPPSFDSCPSGEDALDLDCRSGTSATEANNAKIKSEKDGLAGRADHRRGEGRSNPGMSRLRGWAGCRGLNQRGSEGSRVLRTAFRKPTTPRGAAPVTLGWPGGGLCCGGRSSGRGQQAPGRTENTREPSSWGFHPQPQNPNPTAQSGKDRPKTAKGRGSPVNV